MRIVLVHPAGSNWFPGQKDVTTAANRMAPIGLLSMAAYLEREGHKVMLHDCLGPRAVSGHLENAAAIVDLKPAMVGFTTTTSAFLNAYEMAVAIKQIDPSVKTIFGGVHVSAVGGELLSRFESIDYLCIGEGEETLSELANGEESAEVSGLVWRDKGEVVTNRPRMHLKKLDDLPFPAYEKLVGFPHGYNLPPFSYIQVPGTNMITSRGCVYECTYCDRSVFKRGFRSNSADYIYEHMKMLRERFRVRHINVYDDLFTTNRTRIGQLCERLVNEPLGVQFNCAVHAGHSDDELLDMLKEAGCLMISVGMESGDAGLLERHKAGVTLEQVRETVDNIQKRGIRAKGLFMMGLPGETEATARATSDFIISLGLDDMNMSKFTPFPGAPCWDDIRSDGEFDEDWQRMNCLNFVFVPSAFESVEQMDQIYNWHVKRFYSDKEWRRKLRSRLWQHRHTMLHFMKNARALMRAKRHFEPK